MQSDAVWSLIQEELPFLPQGGVDWSRRPFAKRWSQRRLGWAGLSEVLAQAIPLQRRCYLLSQAPSRESSRRDEQLPPESRSLSSALSEVRQGEWDEHRWLVDAAGRWLVELAPSRTLSLEFVQARDTRLMERLREGTRSVRAAGADPGLARELSFERSQPPEGFDAAQPFRSDSGEGPQG